MGGFLVPDNTQKILTEICHHFWLKMMVKSGLERKVLKFHSGLQRYLLTCQANSASLGRFFLHWAAAAALKRLVEFQNNKNSRPLFTIQKCWYGVWDLGGVYYLLIRYSEIFIFILFLHSKLHGVMLSIWKNWSYKVMQIVEVIRLAEKK